MINIFSGLLALVVLSVVNGILLMVSYVANNAFPPPLSEEEEAACIQLLKQGDEKAKNTLIERNLRLVAHVVKKFDNVYEDQDDLISIGTIGLIKAINAFDPQKGTKLATFAAKCVENDVSITMAGGNNWYRWDLESSESRRRPHLRCSGSPSRRQGNTPGLRPAGRLAGTVISVGDCTSFRDMV